MKVGSAMRNNIIELDGIAYVPSVQAAKEIGITKQQVSRLVKAGKIKSKRIGSNVLVPVSDVKMYIALENTPARKPGRTAKEKQR